MFFKGKERKETKHIILRCYFNSRKDRNKKNVLENEGTEKIKHKLLAVFLKKLRRMINTKTSFYLFIH